MRIAKLESIFETASNGALYLADFVNQIKRMHKEIDFLRTGQTDAKRAGNQPEIENRTTVVVFGGLSKLIMHQAQKWLSDRLWGA